MLDTVKHLSQNVNYGIIFIERKRINTIRMRKRMAQPVCFYIALVKNIKKEIHAKGRHENVSKGGYENGKL